MQKTGKYASRKGSVKSEGCCNLPLDLTLMNSISNAIADHCANAVADYVVYLAKADACKILNRFANTANGAQSCAILFSLIETAKESKLDPCRYLTWVLKEAPKRSRSDPDWAKTLTPQNAPPDCR